MADYHDILNEYIALRNQGISAKQSWSQLWPKIEIHPVRMREQISDAIRNYESGNPGSRIKRLKRTTSELPPAEDATSPRPPTPTDNSQTMILCENCGKQNRNSEVICVHCGAMLKDNKQSASTRQLHTEDHQPEQFEANGTLMLYVRHTGDMIKVRPQNSQHELVVGRADANNIVKPDIDLSSFGATEMGVSRLHMSLGYDAGLQRVIIADMGSANGLFINGQRLAVKEERVLRDGDQIRLGQLVLDVAYRHAPE